MSLILVNIYDRSLAIIIGTFLFGTVIFSTFWRLWKLVFWRNIFQNLILMSCFYQKNGRTGSRKSSITQAWIVVKSCLTPYWVTFLIFCWLVYDIPSHLNGLILKYWFWHTDSNWVIIMELKRKVEYSWACTFWASLCFKGYRSLPWSGDGVRYYKLSIATGVTSTSIFLFFFKSSICVYLIRIWWITDRNLLM